ncbi:GDSL-type esterase/lipase family protein [Sinomonas mesophila]|uniref:GDSL-type esterase/lipase family protein n=1 Tax=Sinomonas mesophila TaxID=1531955 RepID=UPI0009869299|nr:GDSL-type esterase/lipase family protein [Sinomonas mesophila]
MAITRLRRAVAAAAAALSLLAAGTAPAAAVPPTRYAAVGDSIAAGVGAGKVLDPVCGRTDAGYAALLGAAPNLGCGGATAEQVLAAQVPAIPRNATEVTITVGANDAGAFAVFQACIPDASSLACLQAFRQSLAAIAVLDGEIAAVVDAAQERARGANVVVTGYPLLFEQDPTTLLDDTVNATIIGLNTAIAAGATAAGARYVDVVIPFLGHGLGSADSWINGPTHLTGPYHPNTAGYAAYAAAIQRRL